MPLHIYHSGMVPSARSRYGAATMRRRASSSARFIVLAACVLVSFDGQCSRAEIAGKASGEESTGFASTAPAVVSTRNETGLLQKLRDFMASDFISIPPSLTRKLLGAELRPECSLALLRTVTALKKLEPWVLRLFDATGKYPTGALQLSRADIGAFDECLETEVRDVHGNVVSRGQYCNLMFHLKQDSMEEKEMEFLTSILHPKILEFRGLLSETQGPLFRIGLCFLDDCTQSDLQALVDAVLPYPVHIQVENCVTATPEPWSTTQIGVGAFLTTLAIAISGATVVDLYVDSKRKAAKKLGWLLSVLMAFSAVTNTRTLFHVAAKTDPDRHPLRFLHGMRVISVAYIVFGHCYQIVSDTYGRFLNLLASTNNFGALMITWAFDSVDTFFFLSGFLLSFAVLNQNKNGLLVFLMAVIRRLIRTCVPLYFIVMCFYALPRFVTGPDTKNFFGKYGEEFAKTWWTLLLQIRNFFEVNEQNMMGHLWYLSADFQLFVTSLVILLVLKNRKKLMLGTFTFFSLLGCAVALWTATNPDVLPFMAYPAYSRSLVFATGNLFYIRPFYHAICYFSGCMAFIVVDDFRIRRLSSTAQWACWCITITSALCVICMKIPWYKSRDPTSGAVKLVAALFERVLWSLFLTWLTLACATGRGGFVSRFLSSSFFAPLSRLSYGVYLIHFPFILLMLHASRERMLFSHFTQVTLFFGVFIWSCLLAYMAFLACEAPTAAVEKLVFQRLTGRWKSAVHGHRPDASATVLNLGGGQADRSLA